MLISCAKCATSISSSFFSGIRTDDWGPLAWCSASLTYHTCRTEHNRAWDGWHDMMLKGNFVQQRCRSKQKKGMWESVRKEKMREKLPRRERQPGTEWLPTLWRTLPPLPVIIAQDKKPTGSSDPVNKPDCSCWLVYFERTQFLRSVCSVC